MDVPMVGQRGKRVPDKAPGEYRYESLEQCEESQAFHVAVVESWPPRAKDLRDLHPVLEARCRDCGAWLLVEQGHADGTLGNIRVDLSRVRPQTSAPAPMGGA